ncbi:MAG: DUF3566 domain-containing protein [Actinobacteria bacterium]|nr:DUF3566 domain-containing protein [Actinomycetota bacterium]
MTDKLTATGAASGLVDPPKWRVEGGRSDSENGLDDTVVRIPPVPASDTPDSAGSPEEPLVPGPQYEATVTVPTPVPPPAAPPVVDEPAPKPVRKGGRRTRKARLRLSRLDPWSVMKTVFLFSIAFGIMLWVAVYMVWTVIETSGIFAAVNEVVTDLVSSPNDTAGWRIEDYISMNKVLGISALIAVINVVLMTALGTIAAFLYNLSANILGGLEVTLAED